MLLTILYNKQLRWLINYLVIYIHSSQSLCLAAPLENMYGNSLPTSSLLNALPLYNAFRCQHTNAYPLGNCSRHSYDHFVLLLKQAGNDTWTIDFDARGRNVSVFLWEAVHRLIVCLFGVVVQWRYIWRQTTSYLDSNGSGQKSSDTATGTTTTSVTKGAWHTIGTPRDSFCLHRSQWSHAVPICLFIWKGAVVLLYPCGKGRESKESLDSYWFLLLL